ncbi:MAG: helix-turn-helix domain-containing protein, partial [Chloroflexia bacterium]|nr:helix-turn-helix domain-containing protein [Chloroflexia bacterium]
MSADRVTGVDRPSSIATTSSREHPDRDAGGHSPSRWLSIHGACAYLGVDQSTLRRWSDAGKVPVFRTPGGHRRYAEADLRALVGNGPRREERPRLN